DRSWSSGSSDDVRGDSLSIAEARRIALAAQGFTKRTGASAPFSSIAACVDRLGVLQLDSVNVVCRAHYLPLFARLAAYDRAAVDTAAWAAPRDLFEYWGHEASLVPVARQPLFRWRMARAEQGQGIWSGIARFGRDRRAYVDEVLRAVASRGPL